MPAQQSGLIEDCPEAAIDSTGLERQYTSRYSLTRAGKRQSAHGWSELTVVCDTASHFFTAMTVSAGPSNDSPQFASAMTQASLVGSWARVLGDAAFDSEENHRLCREELGIRSTVIPINRRGQGRTWPKIRYRRQMKRRFHRRKYGQRGQAESAISRHKRRLGPALQGRSEESRERECRLRVLTHNIMILADTG